MTETAAAAAPKERCVLLPVDRSEHSERAVRWYLESGAKPNDHLYVFHAVDTSGIIPTFVPVRSGPIPSANIDALLKEKELEVHELKKKYEHILHGHHLKAEFYSCSKYSDPGEAVVYFCREKKVDYIVMGSRGMGSIRRTFLGSVSDFVLHHVHLPMTIVPPEPACHNGSSHH